MTYLLIVDDEPDIRDTLGEFFSDEGYAVRTAANGAEALDALAEPELPCIVLLDLLMPVLSGNDVIARMQADARLSQVPVLITTSDPSRAPRGVPVLRKPLSLHRLLSEVQQRCSSANG